MLDLFEGGDPEAGPSDTLRVATLVDRGVQEARTLGAEPAVQADLYQTLGLIYQKLGDLDRADALLREALERRQGVHGVSSPEVADSLTARALLYASRAQYDDAERLARDGLAMIERLLPDTDPAVARAMIGLGKVLSDRGKYDDAIALLDEVVRRQTTAEAEPRELASSVYELASAHFYAGNHDQSEALNQQALALYRQVYGDRHPLVSDCLINLGAVQFERGRYADAERLYRQGLDITEAWFGREHHKTAANLTMIARVLNRTPERQAEARDLLGQAIAIRERVYGPSHPLIASTYNELGTVELVQGRIPEAEQHFSRVVAIYREAYGSTHYLIGVGLANLASTHLAGNRFAEAERGFRQALDIYAKTLPANHTNVGIGRVKLGRSLLRQRRYADAVVELLAGYEILRPRMEPGVSWLRSARTDLIEAYEALERPELAAGLRAEQAALSTHGK
jgi:serine/threonine-protein kinase